MVVYASFGWQVAVPRQLSRIILVFRVVFQEGIFRRSSYTHFCGCWDSSHPNGFVQLAVVHVIPSFYNGK